MHSIMLKMEPYCKVAIFKYLTILILGSCLLHAQAQTARDCLVLHIMSLMTRGTDFHVRKQRSYFSLRRTGHCSLRSMIMSRMIIHLLWVHPLFCTLFGALFNTLFCFRSSEYVVLSAVSYRPNIGNARRGAQRWPNTNICILLIYCKLYSVLLVSAGMLNVQW